LRERRAAAFLDASAGRVEEILPMTDYAIRLCISGPALATVKRATA